MFSVCLSLSHLLPFSLFLLSSSVPTIRTLDGTDGSLAWPVAVVGVSDTAMKRSLAEGVLQAGVRNKRHRRPVLKFFGAHTHMRTHTEQETAANGSRACTWIWPIKCVYGRQFENEASAQIASGMRGMSR